MLGATYPKNYKHLADKLGYSYNFIKRLEVQSNPVEYLLADYVTKEFPTKEELTWALVNIGRSDASRQVSQFL